MPGLWKFLGDREIGNHHFNNSNNSRSQYKNITPNKAAYGLELPSHVNIIIGWSPCGKFLISFSISFQSIIAHALESFQSNKFSTHPPSHNHYGNDRNHSISLHQSQDRQDSSTERTLETAFSLFTNFFRIAWESKISLAHGETLCREFCIMTTKWIILASSQFRFTNNINGMMEDDENIELENYKFYLINLNDGLLKSQITIQRDHINLDHHSGVSIFGNDLLLITLLHSQEIRIYKIINDQFILYKVVGRYLYDDQDEDYFDITTTMTTNITTTNINTRGTVSLNFNNENSLNQRNDSNNTFHNQNHRNHRHRSNINQNSEINFNNQSMINPIIMGFKQKLILFIYKNCLSKRLYYENLKYFLDLQIWKAQFINSNSLMIKLGPKIQIQGSFRHLDNSTSSAIIIVYNYQECNIESLWRANSKELVDIFLDYSDYLKFSTHNIDQCWSCTLANCPWQRDLWDRQLNHRSSSFRNIHNHHSHHDGNGNVNNIGNGSNHHQHHSYYYYHGLLASVPSSFQNWQYNPSPFLDGWLFRFDDKLIRHNIKSSFTDLPIKFFCRNSDKLLFTLSVNNGNSNVNTTTGNSNNLFDNDRTKKYVQWIFHPYLPLIICQQQTILRNIQINIYYHES